MVFGISNFTESVGVMLGLCWALLIVRAVTSLGHCCLVFNVDSILGLKYLQGMVCMGRKQICMSDISVRFAWFFMCLHLIHGL